MKPLEQTRFSSSLKTLITKYFHMHKIFAQCLRFCITHTCSCTPVILLAGRVLNGRVVCGGGWVCVFLRRLVK